MKAALLLSGVLAGCNARSVSSPSAPITWSAPVELAQGGGTKGPWQQNESRFDYVDDGSVALLADGAAATVWVDQRTKEVMFQIVERDGTPRARPIGISRSPAVFSWLPRLAVAGDDVFVLWQEIVFSGGTHGGDVLFARSRDGGASFEAPQNLSRSKNGDGKGRLDAKRWDNGSLDLARSDSGTLLAAWTEYDGPLWISRSVDDGASWTAPLQVAGTASAPARAPALATRGDEVALAWTVGEDRAADLQLARSDDGGRTFSEPITIARTPGHSDAPKLAIDRRGVVHVVWSEDRREVRYTRSRGDAFEDSRSLGRGAFPSLVLDGDQLWTSWELLDDDQGRGLALTYSLDGGNTFAEPQPIAGSADPRGGWNGSQQGKLMRKLDVRDGRIAIVNSALAHGEGSRVWLIRGHTTERLSAR